MNSTLMPLPKSCGFRSHSDDHDSMVQVNVPGSARALTQAHPAMPVPYGYNNLNFLVVA